MRRRVFYLIRGRAQHSLRCLTSHVPRLDPPGSGPASRREALPVRFKRHRLDDAAMTQLWPELLACLHVPADGLGPLVAGDAPGIADVERPLEQQFQAVLGEPAGEFFGAM